MENEQKDGSRCIYCGGRLVSHFVPNAVGGQLDGLHCENCGLRFAFAVDAAKWQVYPLPYLSPTHVAIDSAGRR